MGYPYKNSFVAAVKEIYPNCPNLHNALDSGSSIVGRYLDDGGYNTITPKEIMEQDIEILRKRASEILRKQQLYHWFVTGECYEDRALEEMYCPSLYMQNNDFDFEMKVQIEKSVCGKDGCSGYYPACKNWGCREKCWKKYREFMKMKIE